MLCYFSLVAATNYYKLARLTPQKYIVSQLWRPEVQDQGVSRATYPLEAWGQSVLCLLELLVTAGIPWLHHFILSRLRVCVCVCLRVSASPKTPSASFRACQDNLG